MMTRILNSRPEVSRLLALAWPVMLVSLNWTLLQVTDLVFVGDVSLDEAAGFAASRAVTFITIVTAIGALSGILVDASRADGAGDKVQTGDVLRTGVCYALVIGVGGGALIFFFAEDMLRLVGIADAQLGIARTVIQIMAFAFPAQLVVIGVSNFLEGISRPRRVMAVNLSILPFNALLAWALTSGALGLPRLGAAGAALATTIAVWAGAAAMLASVLMLEDRAARNLADWSCKSLRRAWAAVAALARFGFIPAVASGLELAGFSWLIGLSTQLGDVTAHAFQIVFSIHNVTFAIALGLGSAAGVRSGNAVGEGDASQAYGRTMIAAGLTIIVMTAVVVILILFGSALVALFPAMDSVHKLAASMLALWAPFVIFDGLQVVFMFALRSLGHQVAAGVNAIIGFFLITGGLGWWLTMNGSGPYALVWGSGAGMAVAACLNAGCFWWFTSPRRRKNSG
jgi:multidrug resistance protein, MATE family